MSKLEKFKNIILAGAIGDAFGYFVEFETIEWIRAKWGDLISFDGMLYVRPNKWRISDDTQMTLFCLDAVQQDIKHPPRPLDAIRHAIGSSYNEWYKTQFMKLDDEPMAKPYPALTDFTSLYVREAPGRTCLDSLAVGGGGLIEYPINNSKGCGGIMRVAPIAFIQLPYHQTFRLGAEQAALTHGHPCGYLSSGFFAAMLQMSLDGIDCFEPEFRDMLINMCRDYSNTSEFLIYLNKVYAHIDSDTLLFGESMNNAIGFGWIGEEALGIAMYCAYKYNIFEEVIEAAANHDGDSDSTASLAAQLFIARGGALPELWDRVPLTAKDAINYELDLLSKTCIN